MHFSIRHHCIVIWEYDNSWSFFCIGFDKARGDDGVLNYMDTIILTLQVSPTSEISTSNLSAYIDSLGITTTSTVNMTINIPLDVINAGTGEYFLQLFSFYCVDYQ